MEFEYDPQKSASNKVKHGIDFEEAQALWDDEAVLEVEATTSDEPRRMALGRIAGKVWAAIFTLRAGKIRLISVRRARDEEVDYYEGQ